MVIRNRCWLCETPSACIYRNRRQRIKSFEMVVETTARPDPRMRLFDGLYLRQYYRYGKFWHNLDSSLKIDLSIFGINIIYSLETMRSLASLKFCQFSSVFFYHNFWLNGKYQILMVSSERSRSDLSVLILF